MFAFRLQVIVAILLTAACIYRFTKKYTNEAIAFFTACAYVTNGRILIFDSFTGLIDTTFTLVVYLSFMLIYEWGEKKKYFVLFLITYLLTAIGFLMKGMPALLFQTLTLLTYFIWKKKFRILFSIQHITGILLFFAIIGAYYYAFFSRNDITPSDLFSNLLHESSKRTPGHFGISRNLLHLFTFPPEMLYHYAPWTIFVITLFQKNLWAKLRRNEFVFYSLLIFLVNFPIYWISPEVYPRYLFMFLPLLFSIFFYLYFETLDDRSWQHKTIHAIVFAVCAVLLLAFVVLSLISVPQLSESIRPVYRIYAVAFAAIMVFLVWLCLKYRDLRLIAFVLALLVFRMGFDVFVLTKRAEKYKVVEERGRQVASITKGEKLFILQGSDIGNFDGMSFHIATQRGEVLRYKKEIDTSSFYIADKAQLKARSYTTYMSFPNFYAPDTLRLVKFH
jgi:4-amino-4-deoxy-L-arabinose transferase-like glycosyltransferase